MTWLGSLVDMMPVGVPWIMCNGAAANNTIGGCFACAGMTFLISAVWRAF